MAGSPTAALESRGRQARSKPCSFWGAGLVQSRPPAFPAKMSKLWASTRLWARLSAITRARRWLMRGYRRRIWSPERQAGQGFGPGSPGRRHLAGDIVGQARGPGTRFRAPLDPHALQRPLPYLPEDEQSLRPRSSPHRCARSELPAVLPRRTWRAAVRSLPMPRRAR